MEIMDEGIVINMLPFMENKIITTIFSRKNGLIKGVAYKNKQGFNIASIVKFEWKARLITQLGSCKVEEEKSLLPFYMNDPTLLSLFDILKVVILKAVPEKEAYEKLYIEAYKLLFDLIQIKSKEAKLARCVLFEIILLKELGYGLSLKSCAVTGSMDLKNLHYISPKTGNAVLKSVGEVYKKRLFTYYDFMKYNDIKIATCTKEINEAFLMTGFFLNKSLDLGNNYNNMRIAIA